MKTLLLLLLVTLNTTLYAASTAPDNAGVYIISPADGDTVSNPVTIQFGLRNMGVAPAGIQVEHTGHHHLLIDTATPELDKSIPKDDHHLHFGKGQTETTINLAPGKHTLQLLLGDFSHTPHQPPLISEKITITVE